MVNHMVNKCKICDREFASIYEKPYCGLCIMNYARIKRKK